MTLRCARVVKTLRGNFIVAFEKALFLAAITRQNLLNDLSQSFALFLGQVNVLTGAKVFVTRRLLSCGIVCGFL